MIARRARREYSGWSLQCLDQMCRRYHAAAKLPNGAAYNYLAPDGAGTVTINMPTSRALELAIAVDLVDQLANNAPVLLDILDMLAEQPNSAVGDAFKQLLTVYELSKDDSESL